MTEHNTPFKFPSSKPLSLRANFRWTFLGHLVNAASLWGVVFAIARLADVSAVGQFELGLSIAAPIMAVAMLQLRNLLVTDARGEHTFAEYLGTRLVWTMIGSAVVTACALFSGLSSTTLFVVLLVGAAKCADSLSDIVRGLFQRLECMNYSGISLMIRGPAALVAMGITLWLTENLVAATAVLAGTWLLCFVLYDLLHARRLLRSTAPHPLSSSLRPQFKWETVRRLTWVTLPLGIVMGLISLQTNIPRYVLEGFAGEESLGYFAALARPMAVVTMIATALGQSASPRLARYFVENLFAYRRLLLKFALLILALGILLIVGTVVLGKAFLRLYGPEYAEHHPALIIFSVAMTIQSLASCWGYGLTAARSFRIQVLLVSISCIVTASASFLFVPTWGVRGAALAAVAASTSSLILYFSATQWAIYRRRLIVESSANEDEESNQQQATDARGMTGVDTVPYDSITEP